MPDARLDRELLAEVAGDRPRLGGALHDDQSLTHRRDTLDERPRRRKSRDTGARGDAAPAQLALLRRRSAQLAGAEDGVPPPCRRALENVPEEGGLVLAANHSSNFDPWPLGIPLFPRRFLRFMAKSELFWFPLGKIITAGGAFPVRRGERDEEAIATAVALCRDGHAVVMFPEGTRREKGLRKKHEARWHTGAARIALEAGSRSSRPAIAGTDRIAWLAPLAGSVRPCASSSTISTGSRRPRLRRSRRTGCSAPSPSSKRRSHETAARGRRRLVRAPRLPRDSEDAPPRRRRPGEHALRVRDDAPPALAGGACPRTSLVAWDTLEVPTYRHEALAVYQSGREFDAELIEQLGLLPALVASSGLACAKAPGYEADDFLGAAVCGRGGGRAGPCSSRPRIATRFSSQARGRRSSSRCVARRPRASGRTRCASATASTPTQVPDFIALRGDPSDRIPGARGIGPKKAADLLAQYSTLEAMLEAGQVRGRSRRASPLSRDRDARPLGAAAAAAGRDSRLGGCGRARA